MVAPQFGKKIIQPTARHLLGTERHVIQTIKIGPRLLIPLHQDILGNLMHFTRTTIAFFIQNTDWFVHAKERARLWNPNIIIMRWFRVASREKWIYICGQFWIHAAVIKLQEPFFRLNEQFLFIQLHPNVWILGMEVNIGIPEPLRSRLIHIKITKQYDVLSLFRCLNTHILKYCGLHDVLVLFFLVIQRSTVSDHKSDLLVKERGLKRKRYRHAFKLREH